MTIGIKINIDVTNLDEIKEKSNHLIRLLQEAQQIVDSLNLNGTDDGYSRIIVETDEENPATIAVIENGEVDVCSGYRMRLKPM
ncbi:MAG: hypothetical protein AB7E42_10785 [Anaerotignaceae bacterium]